MIWFMLPSFVLTTLYGCSDFLSSWSNRIIFCAELSSERVSIRSCLSIQQHSHAFSLFAALTSVYPGAGRNSHTHNTAILFLSFDPWRVQGWWTCSVWKMACGLFGWELIYRLVERDITKKEDVLIALTHWCCIKFGFKCIGLGDSVSHWLEFTTEPRDSGRQSWCRIIWSCVTIRDIWFFTENINRVWCRKRSTSRWLECNRNLRPTICT
jgi:hypothetical protein